MSTRETVAAWAALVTGILFALGSIGLTVALIWAIVHFVAKFW